MVNCTLAVFPVRKLPPVVFHVVVVLSLSFNLLTCFEATKVAEAPVSKSAFRVTILASPLVLVFNLKKTIGLMSNLRFLIKRLVLPTGRSFRVNCCSNLFIVNKCSEASGRPFHSESLDLQEI